MKIKPTKWKVLKTEAINMNEDFLWFDDTLSWGEEQELKKHNKVSSYVKVNLDKDPDIFMDATLPWDFEFNPPGETQRIVNEILAGMHDDPIFHAICNKIKQRAFKK